MKLEIKKGDYVLTSRNKLGYIIKEGEILLPSDEFETPKYTPFRVLLGDNTFDIWGDNLEKVSNVVINFNNEELILTAPQAFKLVKMLTKGKIKNFKVKDLKI
jgi:hypothetical protein